MGLAATRCIFVLLSISSLFLVFNFEILEGALHLAGRGREANVAAAVTHDAGSSFLSRFRMLISLDHRRSQHGRHHQRSSAAPAPAPAPALPVHVPRSAAPAPLFHSPRKRVPSTHGTHIAPARNAVPRRLGDGGHTRMPQATIVALAVVGACTLALGAAIAAVALRRSRKFRKGCSKPLNMFCHGSKAQRSPCATRKVSSHPSPDPLYLSSVVQCQESYPNLKQPSQSKGLSVISTSSRSTEIIISDHTVHVKNHGSQFDEVESFHSIPCSHSSTGSITELPLQVCDEPVTEASSPHTDNSPSDSSYLSFSPDFRSHLSPKINTFNSSSQFSLCSTSQCPEKIDAGKTKVNCLGSVQANGISRSLDHHVVPKEHTNSKFRNPPSENNSHSCHMGTSDWRTNIAFNVSNTKVTSNGKESSSNSTEEIKLQMSGAMSVSKSPLPPPPPKKPLPSIEGQNSGQPPLPPPLPFHIHVGKDGFPLPRLKPLHWDKVRAAPNRPMVWNDIRSSSFEFEFDEQMINSLFAYNFQCLAKDEDAMSRTVSITKHVIEHHRLQNTTILLKTLNATTEQVYNSVTQGTGLSVQQLEALVKMKPTKEEEQKLLNYDGDIDMLDPAENFVKEVLTIPMAFQRMEAMLYKETFDDEVAHIKVSFAMIEGACTELRSSRLFLRLLEAVLKTGNRMNVGTLRGGASAFKLDALLKLADIRGADGKTTLLHFVVLEMVRSKGVKASERLNETSMSCHATPTEWEENSAMCTEFIAELSNELGNVKKVASIDLDTLKFSLSNLSCGLDHLCNLVKEDLHSNDKNKNFLQCMESFLKYAENTMKELKAGEAQVILHVRELIEYYHGEVGKDESNMLLIFVIMKDFLGLLDRVCRDISGSKPNQHLSLILPLR